MRVRHKRIKIFRSAFFIVLLPTISCLLSTASLAQITFERTYGGTDSEGGWSVRQTSDGGYIVAGGTKPGGLNDVYFVKTDSLGDTLWTQTYGGSDHDVSLSVEQTSDGGYILTGSTRSFGAGLQDVYLLKTDSFGDTLWTRTYGGSNDDAGASVQQTSDGGYIIVGSTTSFGSDSADVYLIKTDSFGSILWTRTYGGSNDDGGSSVQQTLDGGYIIVGTTWSFGAGLNDIYFIKTDSIGDTIWTRTFGGLELDWGQSVRQTSDGGYILIGGTYSYSPSNYDVYFIKTDSLGDTLWTQIYGGTLSDLGYSVQQTWDGGYILIGFTSSFGSGLADVYLIKTDGIGDTLWTRTYGGINGDRGYSVQQTVDGGYILSGVTTSFGAGRSDIYLIKTDSLGNVLVGVEEESSKFKVETSRIELFQNHPNPFHHSTLIRYALPVVRAQGSGVSGEGKLPVRLTIYDLTGRLVETLVDESQESGVYQVRWEGKNQASGIYFYRLQSGDFTATQKLILLR